MGCGCTCIHKIQGSFPIIHWILSEHERVRPSEHIAMVFFPLNIWQTMLMCISVPCDDISRAPSLCTTSVHRSPSVALRYGRPIASVFCNLDPSVVDTFTPVALSTSSHLSSSSCILHPPCDKKRRTFCAYVIRRGEGMLMGGWHRKAMHCHESGHGVYLAARQMLPAGRRNVPGRPQ